MKQIKKTGAVKLAAKFNGNAIELAQKLALKIEGDGQIAIPITVRLWPVELVALARMGRHTKESVEEIIQRFVLDDEHRHTLLAACGQWEGKASS